MTKQEALKVVRKLGLRERKGKEIFFKFVYGGTTILTTAVPKGKGELRIERKFRQQLKLTKEQLAAAVKCPFKRRHYLKHLRDLAVIGSPQPRE